VVVLGAILAALLAGNLPALALLPDDITGEMEPAHTSWANYATVELHLARSATDPATATRHRELAVAAALAALSAAPAYPGARATLVRTLDERTDVLEPRTDEAWEQAWRLLLVMEGWRTGQAVDAHIDSDLARVRAVTLDLRTRPTLPEREGYVGSTLAFAARRVAQGLRTPPEDWPLALELLDEALRHDPTQTTAHTQRGLFLKRMGRLDEAEAAYDAALAAGLGSVELHNNRGNLLLDLGRPEDAVVAFEAALSESPDHPVVLKNLERARDALR
jgi:tetratricopeptide (TPR) repeat protein